MVVTMFMNYNESPLIKTKHDYTTSYLQLRHEHNVMRQLDEFMFEGMPFMSLYTYTKNVKDHPILSH